MRTKKDLRKKKIFMDDFVVVVVVVEENSLNKPVKNESVNDDVVEQFHFHWALIIDQFSLRNEELMLIYLMHHSMPFAIRETTRHPRKLFDDQIHFPQRFSNKKKKKKKKKNKLTKTKKKSFK